MTHHRITGRTSRRARAAAAVIAAVVLVPLAAGATPAAAATPTVSCTSGKSGLAAKLTQDITASLVGRASTAAVAVRDNTTNTTCGLRIGERYDSASVVKVTVLTTLLWDAQKTGRQLTDREKQLASDMITKSDNAATSALWKQLGVTKIQGFLNAAKMSRTIPGSGGYWGLTQISAGDQMLLLNLLALKNTVLTDASRGYTLGLMYKVVASQRWGVSAGAPSTARVQIKNGWLSRATHGWRVHSVGAFTSGGHSYTISVLTHDNSSMQYGVDTIQRVARAVHKDLAPAATATAEVFTPPAVPQEALPGTPETAPRDAVPATR
ncbi:serine hydrolase [Streptomyces sp. ISL-1]|uniref:serine hydrolase n=1 Tax=Streptomyces sp. ISL-1 TaxID=2817657 RepID=UPI001BEB37FD|nr:serine hydrolase [Streptomyces sp. ISL-1]MBT2387908.1 serine hydrolase [Streptomyces sp. ISL-1]